MLHSNKSFVTKFPVLLMWKKHVHPLSLSLHIYPCCGLDVPSPHPCMCPYSTLVVPRSAVCEAPPSTMFRMVTGWPIRALNLAAGQKQNNSAHAARKPLLQTSTDGQKYLNKKIKNDIQWLLTTGRGEWSTNSNIFRVFRYKEECYWSIYTIMKEN